MSRLVLNAHGLSRRFGGLSAVNDVSLECHHSEIHAVIGPNGAGKTTLINLLSGDLVADSGRMIYDGKDISRLPAHRLSRLGIARSYQKTNIFADFTAFENCRLAAQSRLSGALQILQRPEERSEINNEAISALSMAGLPAKAGQIAGELSHGEQRQLEIAMALALRPKLLLLDEPLSGMGSDESSRIIDLLQSLRQTHAILLVEHDMDAVFSLADVITVMMDGKVIASGLPESIRSNPQVQEAYLGIQEANNA